MNHVPVGSGIRALHVRTGAPGLCARVTGWLAAHSVQADSCDDAFETVAYLIRRPEFMPDIVLVGLDWLNDSDLRLLNFLHETWPSAAVVTYAQELLRRDGTPRFVSIECRSPGGLADVLDNPPAAILVAAQAARTQNGEWQRELATVTPMEPPAISAAPSAPATPELPPLRSSNLNESTDNARARRASSIRTIPRAADLLTAEELAALLQKDFR